MTDDDLLALLDSHLADVLEPAGFSGAQGGWDGVTFFAPTDAFERAYPWLRPDDDQRHLRGFTTDLTLEFDQRTGLLARAWLEGSTVASTLYRIGEGAPAAEVKGAFGNPLDDSLEVLGRGLAALFTEPESRITNEPFVDPA